MYDSRAYDEITEVNILVFATRRNIDVLREYEDWYLDGTFSVSRHETLFVIFMKFILHHLLKVPLTIFTQLITILGGVSATPGNARCKKVALPMIYTLLFSKQEMHYRKVFEGVQYCAR